ncbi:uncharacterized protein EAF01_008318 [Botrytis porri]|uniref:uncharacterized protein n=1 Tax=Botrytis porri TaxID=87229 RepID=UPI0018FF2675|nr:uncharacterized protein EAF01_008318 [Botrytis porri]KAF7899105.1 hypothetical protein EAF01_008318 [Botrytis porri]
MLSSLKAIKMMGASQRVCMAIEKFRDLEFVASKSFRTLLIGILISSYSTLTLAPVVAFGTYTGSTRATNGDFNASRLFVSLILINLLASPLIRILQILPHFGAALGCFSRVEDFFEKSEVIDSRVTIVDGIKPGKGDHKTEFAEGNEVLNQEKQEYQFKSRHRSILSMRHASFGWGTETILHDINLEIRAGQHVAVIGPVGCGKSLLLQVILGEVEVEAGTIHVGGIGIGYCSQNPWLENVSAPENAFRSAPNDKSWENLVAESCELGGLLSIENAHQTVGSGGAKISGGERQRLALARAIATRPAILLLDDIFSAIDKATEISVQEKLFGRKGILREQGTTVFMSLRTQSQPMACIIQATRAGRIEGKPSSATESGSGSKCQSKKDHADPTKISDKRIYQAYFLSFGRSNLVIFFIGAIIFSFTFRFPSIWADGGLMQVLVARKRALGTGWAHLILIIILTSGVGLHGKLLRSVLNAPFIFIGTIDSGSLINRFNQDLMPVDTQLPFQPLNTVSGLFAAIFQTILITVSTVYIVAILPVLEAALFLIQHFYLRTSKQLRQLDLESKAGLHTMIAEVYEGLVTIRAHGWQNIMRGGFYEKLDRSKEPLTQKIQSWIALETFLGAIARIEAFEQETPVEPEVTAPIDAPIAWPASGQLSFENVWTSYDPDVEKPSWSLQAITFKIRAGERVAICGRSGSGKSTLLLSLLALIETTEGAIYLDDGEIVRDALDPAGNLSDDTINNVLYDCALLDKINASGSLSANLGDVNLSVGETQLFVLARIILEIEDSNRGGVVLLDEATRRLTIIDVATERKQ